MTTLPRESKYRHIFNEVSGIDQSYLDINPDCFGEAQHIAVNTTYWAVPIIGFLKLDIYVPYDLIAYGLDAFDSF
jgi:hypothetical protein